MKILIVGDIVGSPGRNHFIDVMTKMKAEKHVDAVIVNAENSAAGRGITPKIADELIKHGADAITLGDHTWDQFEIRPYLDSQPRIIRPANFAQGVSGRGVTTIDVKGTEVSIINLVGRVFTNPYDCPFKAADKILENKTALAPIKIVDMHAEATSEKMAMGWYLDGRVSCVVGTHTHVQTSDERILKKGTAYITDLGMTGSKDSIIGSETEPIIKKFLTGQHNRFMVASENVALEGVILEADPLTGLAKKITRIREYANA